MALKTSSGIGGDLPPFFKPRDFMSAFAVAVEPLSNRVVHDKEFDSDKNYVDAKIAVFQTDDQLKGGAPVIEKVYTIGGGAFTNRLVEDCGTGAVHFGRIGEVPSKKGRPAVVILDHTDPSILEAAAAWYAAAQAAEDADFAAMMDD